MQVQARRPAGDETLRRMAHAPRYNRWLLDRAREYVGRRVLDVGAGIGTHAERLADAADVVVAVESEAEYAAFLERRFADRDHVRVLRADASTLDDDCPGSPFDTVICFNVLEHVERDEEALRRFHRLLSPGGRLLLLVPAHRALYGSIDRSVLHHRRYARDQLRRKLRDAGFVCERLQHVNPVGALGWLVAGRVLGSKNVPSGPLAVYDRVVPLLRSLDRLRLPFGLSLSAVARKP